MKRRYVYYLNLSYVYCTYLFIQPFYRNPTHLHAIASRVQKGYKYTIIIVVVITRYNAQVYITYYTGYALTVAWRNEMT